MMGGFWLQAEDGIHDELIGRTRRGVSLLQYLILERGKTISVQRLIRELWAGRRSESPQSALKTMVSRLRAQLNAIAPNLGNCIASEQGGYRWNELPGVTADVLDLLEIFSALKRDPKDSACHAHIKRMQEIYTGDLFLTGDLANGQAYTSWFHREYIEAVLRYVEQLKVTEQYNLICEVCQKALVIDELDEQLHIELMEAMVNLNRSGEAMIEYRKAIKAHREILDANPSEEFEARYQELVKAGKQLRFNLDVIRNELAQQESDSRGPCFCDYRAFKEIYNIQMRNLERLGSTMFLGVIMLGEPGGCLSSVSRESGMAGLHEILKDNLRRGDIVTRFSENIYAMLLPTVNYITGQLVMDRIETLFLKECSGGNIAFHARISPLGSGH